MNILFIVALAQFLSELLAQNTGCKVDLVNDSSERTPFILNPETGSQFQSKNGILSINVGESVILACPGHLNQMSALRTGKRETNAICEGDDTFIVDMPGNTDTIDTTKKRRLINIGSNEDCSCAKISKTDTGCSHIYYIVRDENTGEPVYEVCHNTSSHNTLWTSYKLITNGLPKGVKGINWKMGDFFKNINPDKLYTKCNQLIAFEDMRIIREQIQQISCENNYLERGHLVANADIKDPNHRRLTYLFINATPQWRTINNGNWKVLEAAIRKYALSKGKSFQVYTGTMEIATLPNADKNQIELYLDPQNKFIPVPKILWKILYDHETMLAVVFVTHNNPFLQALNESEFVCPDICNHISWLKIENRKIIKKGYTYCCSVEEFRKKISGFPNLKVNGLLVD